jgi:2-methylcitrate dehydratase
MRAVVLSDSAREDIMTGKSGAAHEALAHLVHAVAFNDLPAEVVAYAKTLTLDSIGCLIGGIASAPAEACRTVARACGGTPEAIVAGTSMRTSAPLAALCNGAALRYLDFNDAYSLRDAAHPSGSLPPLLALAERQSISGAEFVAALVAAYEVHLRLCESAGAPSLAERGWHNSTNLQIAAAAAASRLLGNSIAQTTQAIAIAMTHGNTLAQIQRGEIGAIKATADGWVAKAAIEAALLAQAGVTGPEHIFEGDAGWEKGVAGEINYALLTAPLDGAYRLMKSRIKAYASVGPSMAPVQAAIGLKERGGFALEDIESILVRLPRQLVESSSVDERKRYPANRETADHSYHYCVAIALHDGACGPAQFADEKLRAPRIRDLLGRVRIESDEEYTKLRAQGVSGGAVALVLKNGKSLEERVPYPPGHARNPLTPAQIEAKFDGLTSEVFSASRRTAIRRAVAHLDDCKDMREFSALLAQEPA